MNDKKVMELAQTLRKSGLAASDYEAVEKAKAILGTEIQNEAQEPVKAKIYRTLEDTPKKDTESESHEEKLIEEKGILEKEGFFSHLKEKFHHEKKQESEKHRFSEPDYDIFREELTVNELMREVGVNPEAIPEGKNNIENIGEKISELREELFEEGKNPDEGEIEEIKRKMEKLKEEMLRIEKEKAGQKG